MRYIRKGRNKSIDDEDVKVIAKIFRVLEKEDGMTVDRASEILRDARDFLPVITPLKKSNQDEHHNDLDQA